MVGGSGGSGGFVGASIITSEEWGTWRSSMIWDDDWKSQTFQTFI